MSNSKEKSLKQISSENLEKQIAPGIAEIEKAIENIETKNMIENIIESYSKLDRNSLFAKTTYLVQSLSRLCGQKGTQFLLNVLTRGSSEGAYQLTRKISNENLRRFLEGLVSKYGAQYQWFLEPFPKDWQRSYISTKYLGSRPVPIISTKIIDKSGNLLELESPLPTYVSLLVDQFKHLKATRDELRNLGQPNLFKGLAGNQLARIKDIIEELLEVPKETRPKKHKKRPL